MFNLIQKFLRNFRPYTNSIEFSGTISGDLECFCWDGTGYCFEDEKAGRLYPYDVMMMLNCVQGRKYRFTVTAEELE